MDFTSRKIFEDSEGKYRYVGRVVEKTTDEEGNEIDIVVEEGEIFRCNYNGDVYIEVTKEVFDAPLPQDMKGIILQFYPELSDAQTLRDIFPERSRVHDAELVCFQTGIYHKVVDGAKIGYTRKKKTSDFEFAQFMSLVNGEKSNVWAECPDKYKQQEIQ